MFALTVPGIVLMIAIVIRQIVAGIWAVGAICIITGGFHRTELVSEDQGQKTKQKQWLAPVGKLNYMHVI